MRFIYDTEPPVLELSRRNLAALLAKLDDPLSVRTLRSPGLPGEPEILVTAVEDAQHYGDRPAGDVCMPSAGITWAQPAIAGYGKRLVELLADLEAQRWQPEVVLDLLSELRDVLGIPRDVYLFMDGIDGVDPSLEASIEKSQVVGEPCVSDVDATPGPARATDAADGDLS